MILVRNTRKRLDVFGHYEFTDVKRRTYLYLFKCVYNNKCRLVFINYYAYNFGNRYVFLCINLFYFVVLKFIDSCRS